jgi:hypothetical protein
MEASMRFKLFFLILAAFCCIATVPAVAQESAPKGQLMTVHEDAVIPSMVEKYEKAAKNFAEMITKSNISSLSYTAANRQDFVYFYFTPVENMGGVDKMGDIWDELQKKVGKQNFDAAMKQFDGCYLSHKNYMVRSRPELSYNPEFGSSISDGMLFRHWDFYYIHPGMENEADNIAKEWVALSKKVGMPDGYRLYSGSYGSDTPVFIVAASGKSATDYYTRQEAWMKKAGADAQALLAKTWKVIRKFESVDGAIRPDISVLPKETTKK